MLNNMKKITKEELDNAPGEIKILYAYSYCNIPIGQSKYEELKHKYPEYFTLKELGEIENNLRICVHCKCLYDIRLKHNCEY